jgi:phosphatidylglycerophosphatase A
VFALLHPWLSDWQWTLVLLLSFAVGWWACTRAAQALRQSDPSAIVWDEVLGIWLVLWLVMPTDWLGQLAAVALFRLFDIWKPSPVREAEKLPGGWGVMADDLVAGALGAVILWGLARWMW